MRGIPLLKLTVVALALVVWSYVQLSTLGSQAADPNLSGVVPDPDTRIKPDQTSFDNFAWQVFVALNWPALADGSPDLKAVIGQRPGAPRVWERYTDPNDIFYDGACKQLRGGKKAGGDKQLYLPAKRIEKVSASDDTQAASNWPLVDQAHNFAVYEILINDTEANYICTGGLTSASQIGKFVNDKKTINFPFGSIEIKAAWRLFPPETPPAVRARYHTREATITIPKDQPAGQPGSGAPRPVRGTLNGTVGLVGLHIAYKIQNQPKWIWATFEHVDNYKVDYKPLPGLKPTFNSGAPPPPSPNLNNRRPLRTKPAPDPAPAAYTWSLTQPTAGDYTTTEVARCPNEIAPSAVNAQWQQKLADAPGVTNSPWQYYRLNSVQWFDANDRLQPRNKDGVPVLRNSVLETYLLGDQTLASQVPAVGPVTSDPVFPPAQSTLTDTIVATIDAGKYPQTNTGSNTWSSCVLCHQMALYRYGVKNCEVQDVMTDHSFVFRSFLPQATKPPTCPK